MTMPAAAMPGRNPRQAPTTYHDAPLDDPLPLGCPMCGNGDELVLHALTPVQHEITVWRTGVTRPEFDTHATHVPEPDPQPQKHERIECLRCRWSYSGQDALGKLKPVAGGQ